MALEKSVLNKEVVQDLLLQYYGLTIQQFEKMKLGSANCFRVNDGEKDYFLKEFQASFSKEDLEQEAALLDHLAEKGIPTAKVLKTAAGTYSFTYQDHVIYLQEYVQGISYGYNDFPKDLLPQVAVMLGRIHNALRDYILPSGMDQAWLDDYSADQTCIQYDELLQILKQEDPYYQQIAEDIAYKKELAYRCQEYLKHYEGITYCGSHGDYQGCQLICEEQGIKAVIDFSSARTMPVVWEIMRSYVQSSKDARNEAIIDVDGLCEYVKSYMSEAPLTNTDLKSMPYVYLFQLARSKYGYKEYITTDSEDREGLIRFAFWRTQMCREVEAKAEEIVMKLARLLEQH